MYLNESGRANDDNYFKLKKKLISPWFIQKYFSALGEKTHGTLILTQVM